MQFETIDDPSAQDGSAGQDAATTPLYETERQARAGVYAQRERSSQRGVMCEANLAYLRAYEQVGVALGAFDSRILTWLAGWEPETCRRRRTGHPRPSRRTERGRQTGPLSEQRGQHQRRPR